MEIVFIETTIVSYLTARRSRDPLLAAHQELTREWWEEERGLYRCVTSDEVVREAADGEAAMAQLRLDVLNELPILPASPTIRRMADRFLATGALPVGARSDALHLASAVEAGATYLLTWNCRHLANARILKRMEREAVSMGRTLPIVCTPLDLQGGL